MSIEHSHHSLDVSHPVEQQEFLERMKVLYAKQETALDRLVELHAAEGMTEHLDVMIDDLTYAALEENEQFMETARRMRSGLLSKSELLRLKDEQLATFHKYRAAIVNEAGLPDETRESELINTKNNIKKIIEDSLENDEIKTPEDVLHVLGILTTGKEGEEYFTYPNNLFPNSVNMKWETYLTAVREHLRISRAVTMGTRSREESEDADKVRRAAHNAVTRDVDEILGFSELEDSKWDFVKTRNLLAKMRDSRFPTIETAEAAVTGRALVEGMIGHHATKVLVTKLADLHK